MQILNWQDYFQTNLEEHTIMGNVKIIDAFLMPQLDRTRRLWIYLPPNYDASDARYPVLYMHDGQNIFDKATSYSGEWEIDETLERLFATGESTGTIVVGIDNGAERREALQYQ